MIAGRMSRLRSSDGTRAWLLPARCLIGRAPTCDIVIADPVVSAEHALLRWRNGGWELHDLHSRNGTYVDGRRLAAGENLGLDGAVDLGLGQQHANFWLEAGPPIAHAVALDHEGEVVEIHGGFLALPRGEPEITVLCRESGWQLERSAGVEAVADGAVISVGGRAWRLHLSESILPTADAEDTPMTLANVTLAFVLGGGGELRELEVVRGSRRLPIKLRAHHTVLLALARIRRRQAELPERGVGWIGQAEFIRQLGYNDGRLHVEIHRIRRQFAEVGLVDAANVIERHESEPKLRLGVASSEFVVRA